MKTSFELPDVKLGIRILHLGAVSFMMSVLKFCLNVIAVKDRTIICHNIDLTK